MYVIYNMVVIITRKDNEYIEFSKLIPNSLIYNRSYNELSREEYNVVNIPANELIKYNKLEYIDLLYFYKYIYENYENLDDYILFLSANNLIGNVREFEPYRTDAFLNKVQYYINNFNNIEFEYISNLISSINYSSLDIYKNEEYSENDINNFIGITKFVHETILDYFDSSRTYYYSEGFSFFVSKKNILTRDKLFYLKIVNLFDSVLSHSTQELIVFHNALFILSEKIFTNNYTINYPTYSIEPEEAVAQEPEEAVAQETEEAVVQEPEPEKKIIGIINNDLIVFTQ